MRFGFALLLALLAVSGPAGAQTADAPRPVQAFEESIDVQAVNLEAVVTDSRGRRVTGLALEDFRLLVDGVEMPITYFSEIDEPRQHVAGEVDSETGGTTDAETGWQSRSILVFLDESTMLKARRNLVLRSLIKQIEDLSPGDQMAVVSFAGAQLEVLSDWTTDRERLVSVLKAIRTRPSHGIYVEVARRQELDDASFADIAASQGTYDRNPRGNPFTDPTGGTPDDEDLISELDIEEESFSTARWQRPARLQPTRIFNPLSRYMEVGEAAAGAMRGLPAPAGRKMLMLLTEGFQDPVFAQPVVREAQRLGYSLYPVDVKGLDTSMAQNDVSFGAPQAFQFVSTELDRGMNYTMATMAAETGGKAAINSNRTIALKRLVEDSSSYYLLGFSPAWRGDDRQHQIELTVKRPGLEVRTRDSYVDASRRTRLALAADASLLLGRSRQEQRLIVTLDGTAAKAGGRKVPLTLGVPVESLAFSPREKGFHAEAPFALVVLDDRGERKHTQEAWVSVDVDELPLEGTYARFRFSVDAGKRAKRIVITVHDALTGEALWGEALLGEKAREAR